MNLKCFFLICCSTLLLCGCNKGADIVPVSGQVTIEGKPLQAGFIKILPNINGKGRAGEGVINPDGTFTITTRVNGTNFPGTFLGEHQVEISAFTFKDRKKIWYAPYSYADYQSSKLVAKIDGPTDQLKFDLKWDTEANRARGMVVENIQAE